MATFPAAFKKCAAGVCPGVTTKKNTGQDTWTIGHAAKPANTCTKAPCGCHLFSAESTVADGAENWDWELDPSFVFKADKKKFEWICVEPVLGGKETLCATGSCASPVRKGRGDDETIRCAPSEACAAPCKCVLFRWEKEKRDQKWEKVEGFPHKPKDTYIYWCICIQ